MKRLNEIISDERIARVASCSSDLESQVSALELASSELEMHGLLRTLGGFGMVFHASLALTAYRATTPTRTAGVEQALSIALGRRADTRDLAQLGHYLGLLEAALKASGPSFLDGADTRQDRPAASRLKHLVDKLKRFVDRPGSTADASLHIGKIKANPTATFSLADAWGEFLEYRNRDEHGNPHSRELPWPSKLPGFYELVNPIIADAIFETLDLVAFVPGMASIAVATHRSTDTKAHWMYKQDRGVRWIHLSKERSPQAPDEAIFLFPLDQGTIPLPPFDASSDPIRLLDLLRDRIEPELPAVPTDPSPAGSASPPHRAPPTDPEGTFQASGPWAVLSTARGPLLVTADGASIGARIVHAGGRSASGSTVVHLGGNVRAVRQLEATSHRAGVVAMVSTDEDRAALYGASADRHGVLSWTGRPVPCPTGYLVQAVAGRGQWQVAIRTEDGIEGVRFDAYGSASREGPPPAEGRGDLRDTLAAAMAVGPQSLRVQAEPTATGSIITAADADGSSTPACAAAFSVTAAVDRIRIAPPTTSRDRPLIVATTGTEGWWWRWPTADSP